MNPSSDKRHEGINKQVGEKGKLFFTVDFRVTILGWMVALENHQWIPKQVNEGLMRKGISE